MKALLSTSVWSAALMVFGLPLVVLFAVSLWTSRLAEAAFDLLISRVDRAKEERKGQKFIKDLLKESSR